ncbi:hypothetical protein [Natrinema sp. SYSU A 869]|uniref:hypothetical protein n=1 Tax=Natrinema sp. SYSU A 869 TaxID=2871694 RepID=UPI001CA40745|nr:hypothetical protein [Natrinema sp. SYSU A 869]
MILAIILYATLVLGSGSLVLIGIVTVRSGFERYEERAAIVDRPRSSLESVAFGKTALVGTARPDGGSERVPFGGRERAVCYDMTVEDTNKLETAHVDERIAPPFVLEGVADDATDVAGIRVDASDLRLDLSADRQWSREVASHEALDEDLASFASVNNLPDQGLERDRKYAYEYLAPGDEVFVYGRAVPDDDAGVTDGKAVLVTAQEDGGGVISDKSPETLLAERRRVLFKSVSLGTLEGVVGLAGFLWLTGIAQFFLGA